MQEKKYAYMVKCETGDIGIQYHLGYYCVVRFYRKGDRLMTYSLRQYKTIRGAENYLLKDYSYSNRNAPEILYATEQFIKKGSYWKGE